MKDEPSRYATVFQFVHSRGGRVTCRDMYRKGVSSRSAAEAQELLQSLVSAGLGRWEFPPPSPRGGRPTRTFVLTPRRSHSSDNHLAVTHRFGADICPCGAALKAELAEVIFRHTGADPHIPVTEIHAVLDQLRAEFGPPLSRWHQPVTATARAVTAPAASPPAASTAAPQPRFDGTAPRIVLQQPK